MAEEKFQKVTFRVKGSIVCPVCSREFQREELLSGSGRLNAGKLTDELRRLYTPSKKFGRINPLIYPVTVCPDCLYAAYADDFLKLPEKNAELARQFTDRRVQLVLQPFGPIDFNENRDDRAGAASYILAVGSYSFFDKAVSPTFKRGNAALRAAWILDDLMEMSENPEEKERYAYLQNILYVKAYQFYAKMLEYMQTGFEGIEGISLGPGTDKNWGYEGFLYIVSVLNMKMGFLEEDLEKRAQEYLKTKRIIAKLFGSGKASKSKPGEILDMARAIYDRLDGYIKEIEETLGMKFE